MIQRRIPKSSLASIVLQALAIIVIAGIAYQAVAENGQLPDVPTLVTEGFVVETEGVDPAPGFTEAEWLRDEAGNHLIQFRDPAHGHLIEFRFTDTLESCEFAESGQDESQCDLLVLLNNMPYQLTDVGFLEINPLHYTSLFIGQIGINVIQLSGEFSLNLTSGVASDNTQEIQISGRFEKLIQPG